MSEVFIFAIGCLVSLVVLSAVGLLLWGAANEPRGGLIPRPESPQPEPEPQARTEGAESSPRLEPKHSA